MPKDDISRFLPQARSAPEMIEIPAEEAGAGEKTGETVIQKIFDELPVP